MKRTVLLMTIIVVSTSYLVYSFYLSLTNQSIQPQFTGLAIGALLTSSYFVTTKRLSFWTEPEEEDV
ncbi:hypothetical protein A6395_13065 [Exiguobacterium sp. SH31]|uniref:hypothetical protein n=1 Tax=unclassified Exiguobacterium TaxID=2644629 RepID=UPI0008C8244E|nr:MULTISPECIES: hypothetical protein [unclassified Exiguobacterium]OGX78266.1 hypothetical protein A6395_13065 [Exiguobacterium sp. SH31]TCI72137.1 hypothetical protein EVJ22_05625 [Exiguobacterium sp. SH0S7]